MRNSPATLINQMKYKPSIWASLNLAKKTLNCYYNLTDASEVYRIAMGMFLLLLYIFFWYFTVIQCFTHGTSSHISSKQGGQPNGSTLLRTLFTPSSNGHMRSTMTTKTKGMTNILLSRCVLFFFQLGAVCLYNYKSRKIFSTTSPHLPHPDDQSFVMNWMPSSVLTLKMLLM